MPPTTTIYTLPHINVLPIFCLKVVEVFKKSPITGTIPETILAVAAEIPARVQIVTKTKSFTFKTLEKRVPFDESRIKQIKVFPAPVPSSFFFELSAVWLPVARFMRQIHTTSQESSLTSVSCLVFGHMCYLVYVLLLNLIWLCSCFYLCEQNFDFEL